MFQNMQRGKEDHCVQITDSSIRKFTAWNSATFIKKSLMLLIYKLPIYQISYRTGCLQAGTA